jgi:hypothetical protein
MKTVIVDLDGTLFDCRWRNCFLPDYEAFHKRCRGDTIIEPIRNLVRSLSFHNNLIVIVAGRPNTYREWTQDLLDECDVPYDNLYLRGDNVRPDQEFKKTVFDYLTGINHKIDLAIESQQPLIDMWRANGVHCIQTEAA